MYKHFHKFIFLFQLIVFSSNLYAGKKLFIYGKSFEGRLLVAGKVSNDKHIEKIRKLVLFEGAHGNEYFGILTKVLGKSELATYLKAKLDKLDFSAEIVFYPKTNPDGIVSKRRFTSLGRDLNRDFSDKLLVNQEASLLVTSLSNHVANFTGSVLAVDYHCCGNRLLPNKLVSDILVQKSVAYAQQAINVAVDSSSAGELFGQEFTGTLKDYMSDKYSVPTFTFELPNEEITNQIVKKHIDWWVLLLSKVMD